MGGEHHVCFHDYTRDPCSYIHDEKYKFIHLTPFDLEIWDTVKNIAVKFYLEYRDKIDPFHASVTHIQSWDSPKDIYLMWHFRDDDTTLMFMFDMAKIFALAYPGKICMCLDRFAYYSEFPDQEWDMCTSEYTKLDPEETQFKLFVPSDEFLEIITRAEQNAVPHVCDLFNKKVKHHKQLLFNLFNTKNSDSFDDKVSQLNCNTDTLIDLAKQILNQNKS